MARKRGPGRPPLSAAEKARRKAEREGLKNTFMAASGVKRRGRPPGSGRKPGRPAKFVATVRRGSKPKMREEFPLVVAEMAERVLKLEKTVAEMVCTQGLADQLAQNQADTTMLRKQIVGLGEALKVVTESAAATEAKLSALCDNINAYFAQVNQAAEAAASADGAQVVVNQ